MTPDALPPQPGGTPPERRGRPVVYASYWSRQERQQRAEVFQRRELGQTVAMIAEAVGLTELEVQTILRTDRRTR